MALHLIKLCVGVASFEEMQNWIAQREALAQQNGVEAIHKHTTRMAPKRAAELVDGGSLYWVIKGNVQARQKLNAITPFVDSEGIGRVDLVLGKDLVPTNWQPRRPFQGWRYFKDEDRPTDLRGGMETLNDLPVDMRADLLELGLL